MGRRKKEVRHCKKCGKILRKGNKSGYCTSCGVTFRNKKQREKVKRERRCVTCGKRVNPIITYPNGLEGIKIVRYPIRCYECRVKQKVFKQKNIRLNINKENEKK